MCRSDCQAVMHEDPRGRERRNVEVVGIAVDARSRCGRQRFIDERARCRGAAEAVVVRLEPQHGSRSPGRQGAARKMHGVVRFAWSCRERSSIRKSH